MKQCFYLLYACNEWKEYSSMRVLGVTMDEEILCVMAGTQIKAGNMLYRHEKPEESWKIFLEDYQKGDIAWELLEYGYVETFAHSSISSKEFAAGFPGARTVRRKLMEQRS